ncbi:MAG: hypothetical protein Q4P84_09320, partial [Elusimicrobiales bacterium]|nr:hypothetical protein [Elusimicrobiales bacterium]
ALPEGQKALLSEATLRLFRDELAQDKDGSALQTLTGMMNANKLALEEKLASLMRKAVATLPELAGIKGVENLSQAWNATDTQALMLNLHDPATQEKLSSEFARVVEEVRANAPLDPMVAMWEREHADGEWSSKEAFLEFARTYADRLPVKVTVAAEKAIAKALKEPSSTLSQKVKERFPGVFTLPVGSPEVTAAHRELTLAKREFALAEAKVSLARAKAALSEAETRVACTERFVFHERDKLVARARRIAEEGGKPREELKAEHADQEAKEKVLNDAKALLMRLQDSLNPLIAQAEKRVAHLEKGGDPEAEWVDLRPLSTVEKDLQSLRNSPLPEDEVFGYTESFQFLKAEMDVETLRCEAAQAKHRVIEQEARTHLTEVRVLRDSIDPKDSSLKTIGTIAKELAEVKQALHGKVETTLAEATSQVSTVEQEKEDFRWIEEENGDDPGLARTKMHEAIARTRETNKALEETLAKAEQLTQSLTLNSSDAPESPTFLQEIKTHCFADVLQAMQA